MEFPSLSWIPTFSWPLQAPFLLGVHSCYDLTHLRILPVPSPFSSRCFLVTLLVSLREFPENTVRIPSFPSYPPRDALWTKCCPQGWHRVSLSGPPKTMKSRIVSWFSPTGAVKGLGHSHPPCNSSFMWLYSPGVTSASRPLSSLLLCLSLLICCPFNVPSPYVPSWRVTSFPCISTHLIISLMSLIGMPTTCWWSPGCLADPDLCSELQIAISVAARESLSFTGLFLLDSPLLSYMPPHSWRGWRQSWLPHFIVPRLLFQLVSNSWPLDTQNSSVFCPLDSLSSITKMLHTIVQQLPIGTPGSCSCSQNLFSKKQAGGFN